MDIWNWVYAACEELREQGQGRLADIVDDVPSLVCDGKHAQAELVAAEGIVLAKSLDHAWLELFLRHWLAQSRIIHRSDVTRGMEEVIHLLDFAHTPRTRDCPQSVCVTQDVCVAYERLDGPGYAQERLQASLETLQRIDVSWPCFTCISTEYASALMHARQAVTAEEFCREQQRQLLASGSPIAVRINGVLVDALSAQGRDQEALALLATPPGEDEELSARCEYKLQRARLLARMGQTAEAVTVFESLPELDASAFVSWARTVRAMCQSGALENNAALGVQLRTYTQTLRTNGALYDVAWLLTTGGELALQRRAHAVAQLYFDEAETAVSKLRKPERLQAKLLRLRQTLPARRAIEIKDVDVLLESLSGQLEVDIEILQAAQVAWPQHERVLIKLSEHYRDLGFSDFATEHLRRFVLTHAQSEQDPPFEALSLLLSIAVELSDAILLHSMAQQLTGSMRARALFYQAREFRQRSLWSEAVSCLEPALEVEPSKLIIAKHLSFAYRQVNRWRDALDLLNTIITRSDLTESEILDQHWDRMVVATWLSEHQQVRDSAKLLGFKFEGEGVIDQGYAYCDIRTRDDKGGEKTLRAIRISPVVARIISMTGPANRERYHDEVLFEPVSLNESKTESDSESEPDTESDTDESKEHVHEFEFIAVLREGNYRSYDLDGVHPGDDKIEALRAQLKAMGALLSIRSSETYRLTPAGADHDLLGVYAFIAAPTSVGTADLLACVADHAANWPQPITYRALLRELKMTEELERHEGLASDMEL